MTFRPTLATLLAATVFVACAVGPAAAAELQQAPVMDGSGAFLGAPGVTGPGYLAPDPVPLILDEFAPSARNASLTTRLADALAWASVAEDATQLALRRHSTAVSWATFTDLRAKRSSERSSSLVAEVYRSGGDIAILIEDLVNGVAPGRSMHDQGIRTLLSEQLSARAATANALAAEAASERERRRDVLTATASAEIAARAWLGQLLALDRITTGSGIDDSTMRALVELLASRLPALVDDALAAQQLPSLTTPDRRRALAAAENLDTTADSNEASADTPGTATSLEYGALDVVLTGPLASLEVLRDRLPSSVRSVIIRSATVPAPAPATSKLPQRKNAQAGSSVSVELLALDDDASWLFDPVRFSTGVPSEASNGTATTAGATEPVTAVGALFAASYKLFPGSLVELGGTTVPVTELHTAVFAPSAVIVDATRFDLTASGLALQHRLVVDVRTDPQGARTLAALRSVAPAFSLDVTSLTGAPEPSRFRTPEQAADMLGTMPFTANASGKIAVPSSFTAARLGTVSLPLLGRITCGRDIAPQLAAALAHLAVIGYADQIAPGEFGGCYNPRLVGGTNYPSFHARGLAIDLGVPANLQGTFGTLDIGLISVFKSWGFRWGGDWVALDPMHFEAAALLE